MGTKKIDRFFNTTEPAQWWWCSHREAVYGHFWRNTSSACGDVPFAVERWESGGSGL